MASESTRFFGQPRVTTAIRAVAPPVESREGASTAGEPGGGAALVALCIGIVVTLSPLGGEIGPFQQSPSLIRRRREPFWREEGRPARGGRIERN
jgi:hypothetical protein